MKIRKLQIKKIKTSKRPLNTDRLKMITIHFEMVVTLFEDISFRNPVKDVFTSKFVYLYANYT